MSLCPYLSASEKIEVQATLDSLPLKKIEQLPEAALPGQALHLFKQKGKRPCSAEITPEKNIVVLLKDRFASGSFKVVSRAYLAKENEIATHAVLSIPTEGIAKEWRSKILNALALQKNLQHKSIVKVHHISEYFSKSEPRIWKIGITQEYCPLRDLHTYAIEKKTPLSYREKLRITKDALEALTYLHGKNIHHRDIKAENFFLYRNPQGQLHAKLGDFDFAMDVEKEKELFVIEGTEANFPPEFASAAAIARTLENEELMSVLEQPEAEILHARFKEFSTLSCNCKGDIWSLGVVFLDIHHIRLPWFDPRPFDEVLTNTTFSISLLKRPDITKLLNAQPPDTFPPRLVRVLSSMLEIEPKDRISAKKCLAAFRDLLEP